MPGRAEASDKSEMITQLLFGEIFTIIEAKEKFVKVKNHFDGYECWICKKQYKKLSQGDFDSLTRLPYHCSTDLVHVIKYKNSLLPIIQGSTLPFFNEGTFKIGTEIIPFEGSFSNPSDPKIKSKIVEDAFMYLNAPYLWGGKSPFGIDCSGFTQIIYKINNIVIPRDAHQQAKLGEGYSFIEEAEEGDLAFFDNDEGKITHVGILLGNNKIIHASGKVRIDTLDHQGIYNAESNSYSHNLRIIKKII